MLRSKGQKMFTYFIERPISGTLILIAFILFLTPLYAILKKNTFLEKEWFRATTAITLKSNDAK